MTFERWHATYLEGPGAMPAACIIALADGEIVGYTGLRRRGSVSPTAENMLTAVRRPWRRRGIATALKREQIARAREAGIEQIYTTNVETNVGSGARRQRAPWLPAGAYPHPRQRPPRSVDVGAAVAPGRSHPRGDRNAW
jgi:GNAT superfamily N-acetyltransferase